jgi:hypothetical protein
MVSKLMSPVSAIALAFVVLLSAGPAVASTRCERRYRDLAVPVYDRLVIVYERRHLTCSQAARVGSAVADAYERGLPLADYPPPVAPGFPGGESRPFRVHTRPFGSFTCRMTARGSDFVAARCRRGARFVRFASENHYFRHGH